MTIGLPPDRWLQVRCLGPLEVTSPAGPIHLESAKTQALLAFLALYPGPHPRARLQALLWSPLPEAHARRDLRHALWNLRRQLTPPGGASLLLTTSQTAALDHAACWVDAHVLSAACDAWPAATWLAADPGETMRLSAALGLYRASLLEGLCVADAPQFSEWLRGERARWQAMAGSTLQGLAEAQARRCQAGLGFTADDVAARRVFDQILAHPAAEGRVRELVEGWREQLRGRAAGSGGRAGPPLRVVGLGGFAVWQGMRTLAAAEWLPRKAGELFRYLLLQPQHCATRTQVEDALWPRGSVPPSPHALYHATSTLRRLLEPALRNRAVSGYLLTEGDQLRLRLPPGSTVDFDAFETALNQALACPVPQPGALAQALASYTGDLFPLDLYAEWAAVRRQHLLLLYQNGLLALARAELPAAPERALRHCRRLLERDAWNEAAVLVGMQACQALGDRPGALRLYRALEQTLLRDLQLAPRADLTALARSL